MGKSTNSRIYYEKLRKIRLAEANVTEVKARTLSRTEIESLLKERYGKKLKPIVMKLSMRKHGIKSNFDDMQKKDIDLIFDVIDELPEDERNTDDGEEGGCR